MTTERETAARVPSPARITEILLPRGSFARFCVVGLLNTLAGLGSIFVLVDLVGIGDVPANLAGYIIGLGVSFVLNRTFTFSASGPVAPMIPRFMATFALAYCVNLGVLLTLLHYATDPHLAHALATAPYTVVFYHLSRRFVFSLQNGVHASSDAEPPPLATRPSSCRATSPSSSP